MCMFEERENKLDPRQMPFCATCNRPVELASVTTEIGSGALFLKVKCHGEEEVTVVTLGEQSILKYSPAASPPVAFKRKVPYQLELKFGG